MHGDKGRLKTRRQDTTQAVIDGILKFLATGGFLTAGLAAPNSIQVFGKPLLKMFNKMDARAADRELRRIIYYMKQQGLIRYTAWDYQHGISLTKTGRQHLKKREYRALSIKSPAVWDQRWRLVFFDIPQAMKSRRTALTQKLKVLGFQQLQQSIWIHPFPARAELEMTCEILGVRSFVSYVEISEIDNDKQLQLRFKTVLQSLNS